MKTLVTGGCGFIGSNLVDFLLKKGDQVTVIDNLSTGDIDYIKEKDVRFIHSNIDNFINSGRYNMQTDKFDVIYHLAAYISVPGSISFPKNCFNSNITGITDALEIARHCNAKFVFASSSSVYGEQSSLNHSNREGDLLAPISPYGFSKQIGELYCESYSRIYNLNTVCLRFFNVFGPRQNPKSDYAAAIPKFITSYLNKTPPTIYGDGNQTRAFTYVDDVVNGLILAGTKTLTSKHTVLNLSSTQSHTINEVVECIRNYTGQEDIFPYYTEERKGDILHSCPNCDLSEKLLGFKAEVSLNEGIKRTVQYLKGL